MIGRRAHDDAQSFEDALNGAPVRDQQLADLVRLAEGICEAAVVEPSAAFRGSLRTQLMTEAATTLVPMPPEPRRGTPVAGSGHRIRRRIATVAAVLIAAAGGVGLVTSSASAIPGDMLYPVKRSVESVELQLHRGDGARGSFQLDRAAERLVEARQLNAEGRSTGLIADTLEDFSASAEDGSTRLFNEFSATGEEKSIRKVNDFVAASSVDLSELSSGLPAGAAADAFAAAQASITDLASEASTLCGSCTPPEVRPVVKSKDLTADDAITSPPAKPDLTTPAGPGVAPSPRPAATKAPEPDATPAPSKAPATVAPTTPAPVPVLPTLNVPPLSDVTDPLLGGLLGDETQEGLVPEVVDGLVGDPTPAP